MSTTLHLKIILQSPPPNVAFGLQKGSGSNYETVQKQTSGAGDLHFQFDVVTIDKEGAWDFKGPFVQGKKGERFVYIDIGTYAGHAESLYGRRLKIPLYGISAAQLENALSTGNTLTATVPGTGKDGTPACATVKPFNGWH